MSIPTTLRRLRLDRGLTQEQVARQLGVTRQAVSSYESGRTRPDIDTLLRLCTIYDTDLETLLQGEEAGKQSLRRVRLTARAVLILLPLLTAVSSCLLWTANRRYPLPEGQLTPEEILLFEARQRLTEAWAAADALLLVLSLLAFALLLFFLVTARGRVPWQRKLAYCGVLSGLLLVFPLLFGASDPLFSLTNYLVTPLLVISRLLLFLAIDLAAEAFLARRRRPGTP